MTDKKKLPIGIEDFEKLRRNDFYYVDKTGMIRDLLNSWSEVSLFTRPRRFGKSLNMSMLRYFFEIGDHRELFDGLEISEETELCDAYMGKFPVISISLKSINAPSFSIAYDTAVRTVNAEARRFQYLLNSENLIEDEKEEYKSLLQSDMDASCLYSSLRVLTELLEKHHKSKVVILIDEYDVPLAKAHENGYYDDMVFLIRNLLEQALKTNPGLQFAVLSGCMRISRESIFTGLNNVTVLSVSNVRFDEYFGFTDREVRELLDDYGLSAHYDTVREWYDGYQFGNSDVYCPWDVINYCYTLMADPEAQPENYWINTSGNDAVRRFVRESDNSGSTKREIEKLLAGETIVKEIRQELTYRDMYASIENIWSVLFTTGYLTQRGKPDENRFTLAIPNREIHSVFATQIMELFRENVRKDGDRVIRFCEALKNGDAKSVAEQFGAFLRGTISIRDTFVRKERKENFFHGILLGILAAKDSWIVSSNEESGDGYSDILIEIEEEGIGIVLEIKYAENGDFEAACREALDQIEDMHYDEKLRDEGMEDILKYGVACYKKRCRVVMESGQQKTLRGTGGFP
ncbi:MAG: ATP-binding protein [Clostridiales bacterium]|nr:ATP-binding protein [Clostridiales bacterium]